MTTQEMHIEIDLELQKINSQNTKNLLPQEKDWFLNNEVRKFIEQRTYEGSNTKGTGFEDTAKRVEDIRDLVRTKELDIKNSNGEEYCVLPSNYFKYIRFDAFTRKDCTTATTSKVTKNACTFALNLPTDSLTTFKIEMTKDGTTTEIFNINSLPSGYLTSTEFDKQRFLLINALLIQLQDKIANHLGVKSSTISLYWEKEGYDYNSYSFTLITDEAFTNIIVTSNTVVTTYNAEQREVQSITDKDFPLKAKLRLIDDEFLSEVETSYLSKSRANSPIGVLREGCLELSKPFNAIYGKVKIIYICEPNRIDLLLDSNLNMSRKVCKEIVGNTVRFIKGLVETNNYQTYAQENVLIE